MMIDEVITALLAKSLLCFEHSWNPSLLARKVEHLMKQKIVAKLGCGVMLFFDNIFYRFYIILTELFCDIVYFECKPRYTIDYLYREELIIILMFFKKLAFFVVPCVSGFIEFYYLFLFPDFKGVNRLC